MRGYELSNEFTRLRNDAKYSWLREIPRKICTNALMDLDKAYRNYYLQRESGISAGIPKYKSKIQAEPAFSTRSERIYIDKAGLIYLEGLGHMKFKSNHDLRGRRVYNARIRYRLGKWILRCSLVCEESVMKPRLRDCAMGIDV